MSGQHMNINNRTEKCTETVCTHANKYWICVAGNLCLITHMSYKIINSPPNTHHQHKHSRAHKYQPVRRAAKSGEKKKKMHKRNGRDAWFETQIETAWKKWKRAGASSVSAEARKVQDRKKKYNSKRQQPVSGGFKYLWARSWVMFAVRRTRTRYCTSHEIRNRTNGRQKCIQCCAIFNRFQVFNERHIFVWTPQRD